VATAVHHLVVTYWQAAIPTPDDAMHHGTTHMDGAHALSNATSCAHPPSASINGYTQAVASMLGGAAALLPMCAERLLQVGSCVWAREILIVIIPLGLSLLLYAMSVVKRESVYAASYVLFHVSFELVRVLCEAQGARCVAAARVEGAPRFAAVSGLNTTISLALQVVLQLLFNHPSRLPLDMQFRILAGLLLALHVAYAVAAASRACKRGGSITGYLEAPSHRGAGAEEVDSSVESEEHAEGRSYQRYRDPATSAGSRQ